MRARCTWASRLFASSDIEALAAGWFQVLAALAYQVADAGDSGHTQSDLPLVPLTAAEIDYLERDVGSGRGGK